MALTIARIITVLVLILTCLILIRIVKPSQREIKCAFTTALIVAVVDYLFEFLMGYFKVWVYHFPSFNFLHIPIDLFFCFFFLSFALCIGFTFFLRLEHWVWKVGYVIVISLLLSTHAYFKNIQVASKGLISFIVDTNSIWFMLGNYISITFVIAFTVLLYVYLLNLHITDQEC